MIHAGHEGEEASDYPGTMTNPEDAYAD